MLLLGGGRFSALMGDVAKGVKQFKKGMSEEDDAGKPVPPRLAGTAARSIRTRIATSSRCATTGRTS